jgi:NAD(P)-dependent dehydrogenase (short-subunit alcohol dehydrogenase family)
MPNGERRPEELRAVVTGAASGIGRATALRLAGQGMNVIGVDRNPIEGDAFPAKLVDLGDRAELDRLCAELLEEDPPIDVLVNVAGIFAPQEPGRFDLDAFRHNLEVNLYAPAVLASSLGAAMRERRWGRIVNVSSVEALLSQPGSLGYGASKAGLASVTRTLAIELSRDGVLVNAVAPGFTRTPMSVIDGVNELDTDAFRQIYVDAGQVPIGRAAEPQEIAVAISWLASPENSYVTGATLVADGGLTIRF